ncbi:hypothetical protein AB0323_06140 [Arthrobacter sp. NPDC080031]|uniref:hypothetical protein n=1 Tax=Arthrobacter sp. NPDC080031 TaxID=3155918 RepID=UPI00344D8158
MRADTHDAGWPVPGRDRDKNQDKEHQGKERQDKGQGKERREDDEAWISGPAMKSFCRTDES